MDGMTEKGARRSRRTCRSAPNKLAKTVRRRAAAEAFVGEVKVAGGEPPVARRAAGAGGTGTQRDGGCGCRNGGPTSNRPWIRPHDQGSRLSHNPGAVHLKMASRSAVATELTGYGAILTPSLATSDQKDWLLLWAREPCE